MALFSKISVAGTDYFDCERVRVRSVAKERASTFDAEWDNSGGTKKTTFTVGDEVIVHVNTTNSFSDATRRFTGILERIEFKEDSGFSKVFLSGRDYGARLIDAQARDTYTSTEVSVIIKDLLTKYATSIGQSKIQTTSKTIDRIGFRHKSLWECIEQLADMVGYVFFVDAAKDLVFAPTGDTTEVTALSESNVLEFDWDDNSREIFNQVWVYGDRYLSGWSETFTADGAGSVYTLDYNPHDTVVTVNSTIRRGHIFELASTIPSGANYLVDYDQSRIVLVSGTNNGDFVNISGQSIVIDYNRALPIVKVANDNTSQNLYGVKEKVIVDKEIKDAGQAADLARAQLVLSKDLRTSGDLKLRGNFVLTAGNNVVVSAPNQNITSETFRLMEVRYDITQRKLLEESIASVRVAERTKDLDDNLRQIIRDIHKLKTMDIGDSDLFTRLEYSTGSMGLRIKEWYVRTRTLGSSFVLGMTPTATGTTYGGRLGSIVASGICPLGDTRTAQIVQHSGGTF